MVYELAKDLGVLEHSDPEMKADDINFVQSNGNELPAELNKKLVKLMTVLDVNGGDDCALAPYADLVKSK